MTYDDIIKCDPFTIEWTPTLFNMVYGTHSIKVDTPEALSTSEIHNIIKEKALEFMVKNFEEVEMCLPAINNHTTRLTPHHTEYEDGSKVSYTIFIINQRASKEPLPTYKNTQHRFDNMSSVETQKLLVRNMTSHTPIDSVPGIYLYDDYTSIGSTLNINIPKPFDIEDGSSYVMGKIPPNCILMRYLTSYTTIELQVLYIPDMIPELKTEIDRLQSLPNYLEKLDDENEVPF